LRQLRHGLCMCAIQRVNGQDKKKCAFERGMVVDARHTDLYQNDPPPKGHPANLTQLWEALESTWASIPVERFLHLVESVPRRIEAVLRAKRSATQYSEGVYNV
jgi:hypothetical protein